MQSVLVQQSNAGVMEGAGGGGGRATIQQSLLGQAAQLSLYLALAASVSAATCHHVPIDVEQGSWKIHQMKTQSFCASQQQSQAQRGL